MRLVGTRLPALLAQRGEQLVQRGARLWAAGSRLQELQHLAAQVAGQLVARKQLALLDGQILRDLRQIVALVRRHGEVVGLGPALGDLAPRADQRLQQPGADDRRAAAAFDVGQQPRPLLHADAAVAKTGRIPQPPALEAHEEHRRPPVSAAADRAARHGHGAVDDAVALQLAEEDRHELHDGFHGDVALHSDHSRNAGSGQTRSQRGQRALVAAAGVLPLAGALARSQHDQRRTLLQAVDVGHELLARHRISRAFGRLQKHYRPPAGQLAVRHQVEHVVAAAQLFQDRVAGCLAAAGQLGDADLAQRFARPRYLAVNIHRGQAVLPQIGRVGDGHQHPLVALGTQGDRPPVLAAEIA